MAIFRSPSPTLGFYRFPSDSRIYSEINNDQEKNFHFLSNTKSDRANDETDVVFQTRHRHSKRTIGNSLRQVFSRKSFTPNQLKSGNWIDRSLKFLFLIFFFEMSFHKPLNSMKPFNKSKNKSFGFSKFPFSFFRQDRLDQAIEKHQPFFIWDTATIVAWLEVECSLTYFLFCNIKEKSII